MAYLYYKTGGTATGTAGRYTTAKTGSWSTAFSSTSEYYGTLNALSGAGQDGDVVCISNASTNPITYYYGGVISQKASSWVGVEDNDVSVICTVTRPEIAVTYSYSSFSYTYTLRGTSSSDDYPGWWCGIDFTLTCSGGSGYNWITVNHKGIAEVCALEAIGDSGADSANIKAITILKDSSFRKQNIAYDNSVHQLSLPSMKMFNVTLDVDVDTTPLKGILEASTAVSYYFYGVDFSAINMPFFKDPNNEYFAIAGTVTTECSRLHATNTSTTYAYNPATSSVLFEMRNNTYDGSRAFPDTKTISQAYTRTLDPTVYRDDGALYNGASSSSHYSIKIDTTTISFGYSHRFHHRYFPVTSIVLDMSVPRTFIFYIKTSSTLYKNNIWIAAAYCSVNPFTHVMTPKTFLGKAYTVSASAIDTSTKTWNSSTTGSNYLSITTPGDGSYSPVYFYVAVPFEEVVYICPKVEMVV